MSDLRVAFYVRNAFQVSHLRPLFRAVHGAKWVVSKPQDAVKFGIGADPFEAARLFLRRKLETFDVVVSHAGPPRGRSLKRAKFFMVQYGYAKEPYNFGAWRASAQAICAYGPYAVDRFAPHAPAYAIGNPRMDDWISDGFVHIAKAVLPALNPDKPVVLYAPTWGDLSSLPQWSAAVSALAVSYTVLIKAHHNSLRDGQLDFTANQIDVHDVSGLDLMQCLAVTDVVISDYSGAIFDGILCEKPVVLLDVNGIEAQFGSKLDGSSIEMARRDELGVRVADVKDLATVVAGAVLAGTQVSDDLRDALFLRPASVGQAFEGLLHQLMREK